MNQKLKGTLGLLTVALFVLGLFGGLTAAPAHARMVLSESQITSSTTSQEYPDVYGFNIVWQDNRNGNWDIYLYNVMGQYAPDTRITTNSANQMHPKISGQIIVYEDYRNGNSDIYMYNLTSQTETRITTNTATQENPDIDGNYLVWQDNRNGNWDIYFCDLSTRSERRLTTSGSNEDPAVSGIHVVYAKWINVANNLHQEVFVFDITNNQESRVSGTGDTNYNPAIFNSRVVYESSRTFELKSQDEVVMHDLVTGASWDTLDPAEQDNPAVDENYIVYQDESHWEADYLAGKITYSSDIYLYNLDTELLTQITNNIKNQVNPAVQGGRIVYQDDRNGNWDIYMTMVGYVPDGTPPLVMATPPQAARPQSTAEPSVQPTQISETENVGIIPAEFQILIIVAMVAAIVALAVSTVYFWNRGRELPAKESPKAE